MEHGRDNYMNKNNDPNPMVYSSDVGKLAKIYLEKVGSVDAFIAGVTKPPCTWKGARQCAITFAPILGISEAGFMKRWKAMR